MQKTCNGQTASAGTPPDREMTLINRWARTPLTAAEVYCFAVKLCDNDIDRDCERFDDGALDAMAALFVGKTGLLDHRWSAREQVARLYRAETAAEEGRLTKDGRPYRYVKGWAYMLRGEADGLIAQIEGGIKREVSVGLSCARVSCSVCGDPLGQCGHEKGKHYGGALCHAVLAEPSDAYEWSFVAVPAQADAGVMKSVKKGGQALDNLQKEAALGRRFLEELGGEVTRLGALCGLPGEALKTVAGRMEFDELLSVRDALKATVSARYPRTPQLSGAETDAPGIPVPEFMI